MNRFIPREKLSKKARKKLDSERRAGWTFSPVSRKVESKKVYSRNGKSHDRYNDYGHGIFYGRLPFCVMKEHALPSVTHSMSPEISVLRIVTPASRSLDSTSSEGCP